MAEDIGGVWAADYAYYKSGNMSSRTIESIGETFNYTGHQMTSVDDSNLSYDENGNLTAGVDVNMVWNWDNMLRSAEKGGDSISLRYDPSGNRIFKDSSVTGQRKYILDVVGDLPVILLEIDDTNDVIKKTYIYANSQILAQHDGNNADPRYFYLHDRLGSVREIIDTDANVVRMYTYEPFGKTLENEGTLGNPFMFTGQYYDSEIDEYYLRARMYDSHLSRFTSRDPVQGKLEGPLTLHRYLYCQNQPISRVDPLGLLYTPFGGGPNYNWEQTQHIIWYATDEVLKYKKFGMWEAFGPYGDWFDTRYPGRGMFDYKGEGFTFEIPGHRGSGPRGSLEGSEFGNYLAGYLGYLIQDEYWVKAFGHGYQAGDKAVNKIKGVDRPDTPWLDDLDSRYWITRGLLGANLTLQQQLRDRIAGRGGDFSDRINNLLDNHDLGLLKADATRIRFDLHRHFAERWLHEDFSN